MDRVAELFVLAAELLEGVPDRLAVFRFRRRARFLVASARLTAGRNRLLVLHMARQVDRDLVEDARDRITSGLVRPMNGGDLAGVGGDRLGIALEVGMVGIDDEVGQERQLPGSVIQAPLGRHALRRVEFVRYRGKLDAFFRAGCREGDLASAAEVDPCFFEDFGGPAILGDQFADVISEVFIRGCAAFDWFMFISDFSYRQRHPYGLRPVTEIPSDWIRGIASVGANRLLTISASGDHSSYSFQSGSNRPPALRLIRSLLDASQSP